MRSIKLDPDSTNIQIFHENKEIVNPTLNLQLVVSMRHVRSLKNFRERQSSLTSPLRMGKDGEYLRLQCR